MALKFKTQKTENNSERLICIGLIVSDEVIKQLAPILNPKQFSARYTRQIAEWCLGFYRQFERAPGQNIQDIFNSAKERYLDEDVADLIEALLIKLNDDFFSGEDEEATAQKFNADYIISKAEGYIQGLSLNQLTADVQALATNGRLEQAMAEVVNYKAPRRPQSMAKNIFTPEFWAEDDSEAQVLFRFPGELDKLIGPVERDSFISILAPEKVGKTWYLMWAGLLAMRQRCNVAFFSAGDMTEKQMQRRFKHMLTGRDPKRPRKVVRVPVLDCEHNQKGDCPLGRDTDPVIKDKKSFATAVQKGTVIDLETFPGHQTCQECFRDPDDQKYFSAAVWAEDQQVDATDINEASNAIVKRSGGKNFRLFTYPPATLTVEQMRAQLDLEEQHSGFIPDVIILDYADLLDVEPNARKLDYRHQINAGWMALRALSQTRNCAVLTATQAKIEARRKGQVDQWDTSEDKRKLAHVTAMLALNQTPAEKVQGLMRITNIATRDAFFDTHQNVGVLQCLALGKPYLVSFPHKALAVIAVNKGSD